MKITESEIKNLIDEENQAMVDSGEIDEGVMDGIGRMARGAGRYARKAQGALQSKVAGAIGAKDMAAAGQSKQMYGALMGPLETIQANAKKLGLLSGAKMDQELKAAIETLATIAKRYKTQGNVKGGVGSIQQGYREHQEAE